ncbi:MAG: creatininase family protein, partial [Candidatus Zixiibacteriota bacterium]
MERELQRLSWLKVREFVPSTIDTILLPVGTVEAHGSACLGTDNFIPEAIALGVAERLNALVAPTLSYGVTRSLYRYPGGITINPKTYELLI